MRFKVSVSPEAWYTLSRVNQLKLARRAARKTMRMGHTSATVIFPGPHDLQVTVNCRQATILIAKVYEVNRSALLRPYRKSA